MKKYLLLLFFLPRTLALKGISAQAPFRAGVSGGRLLLLLFIISSLFSSAQNPLVKMWDKRYGGTGVEEFYSFQQTRDGGYIIVGSSNSEISGDKTQDTVGRWDFWVVKTDSVGTKEWDKDFGGINNDELFSVHQTKDGGYILGGFSASPVGGDKSQNTQGGNDFWVIKIDSAGSKEWDKDFGSTGNDVLRTVIQTADGGYILGGYSDSGPGGDKTQASWGWDDYWILKTDSLGNKQWDKDFGGSGPDEFTSLQQTSDGGFILGGYSVSVISGDKTESNRGSWDYWIVKTDSLGNKQWDKDFGGTGGDAFFSMLQDKDDGYVFGGCSNSGISGDKTQDTIGGIDYWIVKTDSLGNKQWDKVFGGTDNELYFGIITHTSDDGYLISGISESSISGDKTENNLSLDQTWVIKTDSLCNKQWDKTIFINGKVENGISIQNRNGCYVMAELNNGTIAGYKTQASWNNSTDYWIVEFCDSTLFMLAAIAGAGSDLCPGTCTNFTNLSFNATSYQWSFLGATPDTSTDVNPQNICYANPGSYDVQLIATNANGSDTLLLTNYITVYPTPPPQSITQNGDTLFALTGAATYQWYFNTNFINGATNYFYVADTSGDYNVVATDANGCEVEAVVFNVVAAAPPVLPEGEVITAAPNPVTDKLILTGFQSNKKNISIRIYNMLGEMVLAVSPLSFGEGLGGEADVSLLPSSMYYLEVTDGEKFFRSKFVKQ